MKNKSFIQAQITVIGLMNAFLFVCLFYTVAGIFR